jgi:hypothetical protein
MLGLAAPLYGEQSNRTALELEAGRAALAGRDCNFSLPAACAAGAEQRRSSSQTPVGAAVPAEPNFHETGFDKKGWKFFVILEYLVWHERKTPEQGSERKLGDQSWNRSKTAVRPE